MLCPLCKLELKMTDRQGIEVDYCPQCRGIWLDRGELDKILERSELAYRSVESRDTQFRGQDGTTRDDSDSWKQSNPSHGDRYDNRPRKRESWFSELFDWD
ncbi:MAG: hypothetical protein RIT02_3834 [Planctomycetota bacterium]|jgi:Zn-finger nucleic acid-binding protein